MHYSILSILVIVATLFVEVALSGNITMMTSLTHERDDSSKVLSRKKRFLIFPDGSSFQIVFCTQNHGYLQLGNIVWFGTTAALAWELPTEPGAFDMFRDRYKVYEGKRRSDVLYYVDEDGKVIDRIEYKRKVIINPAFAKRSVEATKRKQRHITKFDRKKMHNSQKNKTVLKYLDATIQELHRKERQKLYVKLEKFLQTLGWNGQACILKMLCQAGQSKSDQGMFVQEILRAIFTLPKVRESVSEVQKQYDDAHGANGDCAELYPECTSKL